MAEKTALKADYKKAFAAMSPRRRKDLHNVHAAMRTLHLAMTAMEIPPKGGITITASPEFSYHCHGDNDFCLGVTMASSSLGCGCYSEEGGYGCDCPD